MDKSKGKIKFFIVFIFLFFMFCSMYILPNSDADILEKGQESFIYKDEDRPDPFLSLISSEGFVQDAGPSSYEEMMEKIGKISVNGILWDESMPVVMINNKMKKEGDIVESLTIKKINYNGIILSFKDISYEILLIKKQNLYDQGGFE